MEHGVALVAVDQALDAAVERGREQQRLVGLADVAQHPLDLGQEAHVGHPVGLVDDDQAHVRQVGDLAVDQVDEPARGRHHDLGAGLERGDLLAHLGAAVDGDEAQRPGLDQRPKHVGDLPGQLAGGDQHEAGGALRGRFGDALDEGEAEREGLARAGLGLAAHVAAGQGVGDAEALDGKSCGQAGSIEHGDQIRGHAQRRERLLFFVAHGSDRAYRSAGRRPHFGSGRRLPLNWPPRGGRPRSCPRRPPGG